MSTPNDPTQHQDDSAPPPFDQRGADFAAFTREVREEASKTEAGRAVLAAIEVILHRGEQLEARILGLEHDLQQLKHPQRPHS